MLSAGLASAGCLHHASNTEEGSDAISVSPAAIQGNMAYGEVSDTVHYVFDRAKPYRAFKFTGKEGDTVTVSVTAVQGGVPDVWILPAGSSASFASAKGVNDQPAKLSTKLPTDGDYLIAFREDRLASAYFVVTLDGTSGPDMPRFVPPDTLVGHEIPVLLSCTLVKEYICMTPTGVRMEPNTFKFSGLIQVSLAASTAGAPFQPKLSIDDIEQIPGSPDNSDANHVFSSLENFQHVNKEAVLEDNATRYSLNADVGIGSGVLTATIADGTLGLTLGAMSPGVYPVVCSDGSHGTGRSTLTCSGKGNN
jgi:hypothetical protein